MLKFVKKWGKEDLFIVSSLILALSPKGVGFEGFAERSREQIVHFFCLSPFLVLGEVGFFQSSHSRPKNESF